MGPWLLLIVLAIIAFAVGAGGIGWWLFIVGAVLLLAGLVSGFTGGWGRRRTPI